MDGLGKAPARTEADIRAALTELGRRAPSADDVLSALREAGPRRQRKSPQLPGQPCPRGRRRKLPLRPSRAQLTVAAAVVTAAAVTLALTLSSSPRPSGPDVFPALPNPPASAGGAPIAVSPGPHPSSASLAKAMLTAFNAAADDLAYETAAYVTAGHLTQAVRTWSWPAVPSPGQLQYARDEWSATPRGASQATAPVKLTEDDGYTTIVPHPSKYSQKEHARLTVVCYAGTGQTGCGYGRFKNTPAGTWSQHTAVMPYIDYGPLPRGTDLTQQIAQGQWRIAGHTRLRGQPAIKLDQTRSGTYHGHPVTLWVSTATYLPLRLIWVTGKTTQTNNWYYLPPSKTNLKHLQVPIPPSYPRSH